MDNPIHLHRLKAGLSQKDLAEKMNVSQAYISKLEKWKRFHQKHKRKCLIQFDLTIV